MRRLLRSILLAIMIVSAMSWTSTALGAGDGTISGQVVNKTPGGTAVGSTEVTLTTYSGANITATAQQKATTDATGKFEFRGLSTDNGTAYTVSTKFQNADYTSEPIALTPDINSQVIDLYVYDSTASDENIQVSKGHIIVYPDQGHLELLEVWQFNNSGDKAFIGAQGKTLVFTLPQGAIQVTPGAGTSLETNAGGAVYTGAVAPGTSTINFSYFVPFDGSGLTLTRRVDYPVESFRLLVQDTGVKVTSSHLTAVAPQMLGGTNFLNFTAGGLARGTSIEASLSGLVSAAAGSGETSFPWAWLLAGVGLLGLLIFAYPQLKKRRPTAPSPAQSAPDDEDSLLRELVWLDDAYEAGTIDEKKYRLRRAHAKARLMGMYSGRH